MPHLGGSVNVYLKSLKRADLSACDEASSFLQSGFWGAFKARFGWEALAFSAEWKSGGSGESEEMPLLVLRRRLAAGFFLAYIPWGPELPVCFLAGMEGGDESRNSALGELAAALRKLLPKDTVFIRFDPPWYSEGAGVFLPMPERPFVRSGADIQPPDTVLVDLRPSMESILEQMKPKWRYNGRLAIKKGVTVRRAAENELETFYRLLKETAKRDGIAIHSAEYYAALFENSRYNGKMPDIRLYLAEHEGDVLAGIVTLFRGKDAVYLYGASSGVKRNLMAPYAMQIKAMEDAKSSGCEVYDLFGIPPDNNPSHPMAGLYLFKTGFGGRIIHRPGSWDYPCNAFAYNIFRGAETLRKSLRTIKKTTRR